MREKEHLNIKLILPKLFEDHANRAQFKKLVMSPIQSKKKMISLLRVRDVADAYPAFRT